MSGTTLSSDGLDVRRRRTHFRCWHRGMREMDLILGRFADAHIATLDDGELDLLETLMEEQDRDLLIWLTGEAPTPDDVNTAFFQKLAAFTGASPRQA
ncbi:MULTISPECIES: FAD assembly factor SdhE [Kaistia]|uniref:FAD assembly factor SdhE n=1 Tax=Kaistia nematophila TaxID=2994654 RepID=A0A9X3IKG1_9HYPH|nr:succinate dehydrogenase assembly factor 2 [Kaistia nematophila]MBN9024054.1 succinate dehydrogenase assembly factor 2 [Hyphomicrobiales bacterium]MBN9058213.1 succinate dehydrogenase assembly factor 2 [Hyphomicrobiales bacterium]MCX5568461.1 succinate dehydrogenase assembly factor 2 [Kaistia nematophila]